MKTKRCSKCGKVKPVSEFNWRKDSNKYRNECKNCQSLMNKKWHKKNLNYSKEQAKKWRRKNPEYQKNYRENNPEKVREIEKKYRENNREKRRECERKWRANNPEKIKKILKKADKKRCSISKNRLSRNISRAINLSLKGNKKDRHWEDLVEYSLQELKIHLESLFKPRMSWNNYGRNGWEIDHIRPISSFSFTSYGDEDFKKCWALSNLQPLWAKENWSKGNK